MEQTPLFRQTKSTVAQLRTPETIWSNSFGLAGVIPERSRLDAAQGNGEARNELYKQYSEVSTAAGNAAMRQEDSSATCWAGWQAVWRVCSEGGGR